MPSRWDAAGAAGRGGPPPAPRGTASDVRAQLHAYATAPTPPVRAGPPSPATVEHLRALGYLPSAQEAPLR